MLFEQEIKVYFILLAARQRICRRAITTGYASLCILYATGSKSPFAPRIVSTRWQRKVDAARLRTSNTLARSLGPQERATRDGFRLVPKQKSTRYAVERAEPFRPQTGPDATYMPALRPGDRAQQMERVR